MNLSHTISADRRTLTITADDEARQELRELTAELDAKGESIDADSEMHDAFDRLIGNSELQWVNPETCGDLTDAPILGVLGEDRWADSHSDGDGTILCGMDSRRSEGQRVNVCDVVERWGFTAYAVRSVLTDLRDTGRATFTAP